jgi:DNA-directed RNA polymerase subunit RPC12/RpoP
MNQELPDVGPRTEYLAYRCYRCGRPITSLQLVKTWEKAEKLEGVHPSLCACGSRHITPTNFTIFEELTRPSILVLWWKKVFLPWLRKKVTAK